MTGAQTWQNGNKGLKLGNYSPFTHVLWDANMMYLPVSRMWNPSFSRLLILGVTEEVHSGEPELYQKHGKEFFICCQICNFPSFQTVLFNALSSYCLIALYQYLSSFFSLEWHLPEWYFNNYFTILLLVCWLTRRVEHIENNKKMLSSP